MRYDGSSQAGKILEGDEHFERAGTPWSAAKESATVQAEQHLVNARCGDGEEALRVDPGRWALRPRSGPRASTDRCRPRPPDGRMVADGDFASARASEVDASSRQCDHAALALSANDIVTKCRRIEPIERRLVTWQLRCGA